MADVIKLVPKTAKDALAMIEALPPPHRAQVSPEWHARINSPSVDHWTLGYTAVRAEDGALIGQGGFKMPPVNGVVEIAYGISPPFEGRGYATQVARALLRVAFESAEVQMVIAHTLDPTGASSRVVLKAGFRSVGQVIDPEDGTVWRWERKREYA